MGEHVLISGYYGFGNTGDEAILAALLAGLRTRRRGARFTVISGSPDRTRSQHGVEAVPWDEPAQILVAARTADVFLVGGGGLFADYWDVRPDDLLTPLQRGVVFYSMLPILARALGKRCVIVGVGVGPLDRDDGRAFTRMAFEYADRATVRDAESLAALDELHAGRGRPTGIEVTGDLAFGLTAELPRSRVRALLDSVGLVEGRPLVVAALRPWDRTRAPWDEAVADGLAELRAATGAQLLFVPFQREGTHGDEDDVAVARRVVERISGPKDGLAVLEAPLDVDMTRAVIAAANVVLAERYHAALFAIAAGLAPVALAYDPKVTALMRRAHLEASCLALDGLAGGPLAAALRRALEARPATRARLTAFAEEMAAEAARNLEAIDAACAQPPRPADPALRVLVEQNIHRFFTVARLEGELETTRARVGALERHLEGITSSSAFKVARRLRDLSVRAAPQATRRRDAVSSSVGLVREVRRLGTRGLAKKYLPSAVRTPLLRAYDGARELKGSEARSADRRALEALVKAHPRAIDVFVLAPSIPWDVALFQRPQQLAMALARLGALVIYVEPGRPAGVNPDDPTPRRFATLRASLAGRPPGVNPDDPTPRRFATLRASLAGRPPGVNPADPTPRRFATLRASLAGRPAAASTPFVRHSERLYLTKVEREVFDALDDYTLYVLSWNKAWTERLSPKRVVYDFIDDLDVFNVPDRAQLEADHRALVAGATVVSATAELLVREVRAARPDAILCPNGVDHAHFEQARQPGGAPPSDIADIVALGKPIVGYYGALARWFDYELLWAVASRRPDLYFLLIGPDYDKSLQSQSLLRLPNVRWIGPRHYSILPQYLRTFDVATVPFKVNAITHATSPLKLFEYMAGGKVVVTTPMQESMRYENVLIGGDAESFSRRLTEALTLRDDPTFRALNDRIARENTWDARADQLLSALGR